MTKGRAALVVMGAACAAVIFGRTFWPNPPVPVEAAANVDLRGAIARAFRYLRASVRTDGSFVYEADAQGSALAPRYNFVRHAGAVWALAHFAARNQVPDLDGDLRRTADFLVRSLRPAGPAGGLAVISDPLVEKNDRPPRAALGATALALLAFLEIDLVHHNASEPARLRALGKFLIWMQKPSGRFWPTYLTRQKQRSEAYSSDYFPGEAALALFRLARRDERGKSEWAAAAVRGLRFLAKDQNRDDPLVDAWALQALREGWDLISERERKYLVAYARRIVDGQLIDQNLRADRAGGFGCYGPNGFVAATAARLEGMLAARALLATGDDEDRRWALGHSIALALACVRRGQVAGGGIMTRPHFASAGAPPSGVVRVDNVQHAMMAMMQFDEDGGREDNARNPTRTTLTALPWRHQTLANLRLRATTFTLADAAVSKFSHVDFTGGVFADGVWRGALFIESKLRGAELIRLEAQGWRFLSGDLREAVCKDSDLAAADFSFSDLRGSRFEGCNLKNASFAGSDLRGATFDESSVLPFSRDEAARRGFLFQSSNVR